jgi:hypothetical protein
MSKIKQTQINLLNIPNVNSLFKMLRHRLYLVDITWVVVNVIKSVEGSVQ